MQRSLKFLAVVAIASSTTATTITIDVGNGGLIYTPNSTAAAVGDIIEFNFYDETHNVVQSNFDSPCDYKSFTNPIYSGFQIIKSGEEGSNIFRVQINSTDPIWYYCGVTGHCQNGMVGVINEPSSGNTLAEYNYNAQMTEGSTNPAAVAGGSIVPVSGNTSTESSSISGATTATSSSTSAAYATTSALINTTASLTGSGTPTNSSSPAAPTSGSNTLQATKWRGWAIVSIIVVGATILL